VKNFRLNKKKGSISVVVLWTLIMLGMLAMGLAFRSSLYIKAMNMVRKRSKAWIYAHNAVEVARFWLAQDTNRDIDGFQDTWAIGIDEGDYIFKEHCKKDLCWEVSYDQDGQKIYGIIDLDRFVNIKTAPHNLIMSAITVAGADEELARQLLNALLDYQDSDTTLKDGGDEPENFKNAPILHMEELWLIPLFKKHAEITHNLFQICVVKEGDWLVNANTAPRVVWEAIFLSCGASMQEAEQLGDIIVDYRTGKDGELGTDDDKYFSSVDLLGHLMGADITLTDKQRTYLNMASAKIKVSSNKFCVKIKVYRKNRGVLLNSWAVFQRLGKDNAIGSVEDWGQY